MHFNSKIVQCKHDHNAYYTIKEQILEIHLISLNMFDFEVTVKEDL